MIFPYSTDAPLYHLPIVTGGIIAANTVIFFATTFQVMIGSMDPEQLDWLLIQYNQINPLQWLTGSFMHAGLGHLVGNMVFLFCFGLVVEGKAGNLRFLAIYLAACALIGAAAQIPMFLIGGEGAALGASGAIMSLMVIALVWAPENEIKFFYWFFLFIIGTFDVRIIIVCQFFIGLDLLTLFFNGFSMSGSMGHMLGAVMGLPIAVYLLRTGQVDCEGWDLISRNDWLHQYPILWGKQQRKQVQDQEDEIENPVATALALAGGDVSKSRTLGIVSSVSKKKPAAQKTRSAPMGMQKAKQRKLRRKKVVEVPPEVIAQKCQAHAEFNRLAFTFRQSIQSGNLSAAQQAFLRIDGLKIGLGLGEQALMQYASQLGKQKQWVNAIRPLAILVEKRGELADDACLRLAQIQLRVLNRSDHAIATLEKITVPEGVSINSEKREQLRKRDEMLAAARGAMNSG